MASSDRAGSGKQLDFAERLDFVLDEQLCFAMYSASRAMTGCYRPLLDEIDLTYSQYVVMLVLWESESVTLGLLCRRLQLDTGTLSPLLKRLEAQGLLTRARRVEDERTMQVTITPAGAALRGRAASAQSRVEQATGLSPDQLKVMRDGLHGVAARLRAAGRGSGDADPGDADPGDPDPGGADSPGQEAAPVSFPSGAPTTVGR